MVGSVFQAVDAVGAGVVRAEHDDAQLLTLLAQALDQGQAAAIGQADVDDGQAVAPGVEVAVELLQAGNALRRVAQALQEFTQFMAQHGLVFEQDHIKHGGRGLSGEAGRLVYAGGPVVDLRCDITVQPSCCWPGCCVRC